MSSRVTKSVNLYTSDGPTAPVGFFLSHGGEHYAKRPYFAITNGEQDGNIAVN